MSFVRKPFENSIAHIKKYGDFELYFSVNGRKMTVEIQDTAVYNKRNEPAKTSYSSFSEDFLKLQIMSEEELKGLSKKAVKGCLKEISHKNKKRKDKVLDSRRTFNDLVELTFNGFKEYLQLHEKENEYTFREENRKKALEQKWSQ